MENKMTEGDLIKGLKAHDPSILKVIFLEYYPKILQYVNRTIPHSGVAEDIAQESISVLILKAKTMTQLENCSDMSAFLYTTAKYKICSYIKKKIQSDALAKEYIAYLGFHVEHMAGTFVIENELNFEIDKYLKTLKGQPKEVFELMYYGNHTIREISEKLGTSEGNVRNQHWRVIEKLRGIVARYQAQAKLADSVLSILIYLWAIIHSIFLS